VKIYILATTVVLACTACASTTPPAGAPTCGPPLDEADVVLVDAIEAFETGGKDAALAAAEETAGSYRLLSEDYFKLDVRAMTSPEYPTKALRAAAAVSQAGAGQGCDLAILFQQKNVGENGATVRVRFYLAERDR